jgi:hypothetical protein
MSDIEWDGIPHSTMGSRSKAPKSGGGMFPAALVRRIRPIRGIRGIPGALEMDEAAGGGQGGVDMAGRESGRADH